jgi:hypothetical protein
MEKILNLTQHAATADQLAVGVIEPADKKTVQALLTFDELPSPFELKARANHLARIVALSGCDAAMIGGAPFFMAPLELAFTEGGIKPLYAFSKRETVEEPQKDGSVKKTQIFRHAGFVETLR